MTGNQSAAVILEYILEQRTLKNNMPKNPVMFNTVVTSDLGDAVCKAYGVEVEKTLTGFKFIGDKVYNHEIAGDKNFVFGYEESYGCLVADFVRDKDAVQASLMLCECAAYYKQKGMTLIDALNSLYDKYGYYLDMVDSFTFQGLEGEKKIKSIVEELRNDPPTEVNGVKVKYLEDYTSADMMEKGFPKSNVLRFVFEDGCWVAVRPSGTEPKCKFYFCVRGDDKAQAENKLAELRAVIEKNC
jgi:phosphoglucomutase